MKRILYVLVALVGLVSCEKDNKGLLDPNAMISIRPAAGVPSGKAEATNLKHLTAREIVQQANQAVCISGGHQWYYGIWDNMRDLENNRFLRYATEVINDGQLTLVLIESTDYIFQILDKDLQPTDTIAYIPNSVLRNIETKIKAAYAKGDYATCYKILDTEVLFTPITGEEWRALKAKNQN